jgi:hypothetical protein
MAAITDSSKFNGLSNYFVATDPQGGTPQIVNGNLTVTGSTTTGTISGSTGGTLPVNNGLTVTGNADISGDLNAPNYATTGAGAVNFGPLSCNFITQDGAANLNGGMTVNVGTTAMQSESCTSLDISSTATLSGVASFNKLNLVPQSGMGTPTSPVVISGSPGIPAFLAMVGNKCYVTLNLSGTTPAVPVFAATRDPALPSGMPYIIALDQITAVGTWSVIQTTNQVNGAVTLAFSGASGGIGTPCSATYRFVCVWF